jgi:Fic family protein
VPPPASQLEERIRLLCEFANAGDDEPFTHPVLRAILIHFMIGYDHPFIDGNGRTARALFYWSMARHGYWMMEFTSISAILRNAPSKYARAYLYTETDDNDATYFICYQLEVILRAIKSLHAYLARKTREVQQADAWLRGANVLKAILNHRQVALLQHALKHSYEGYTVRSHMLSHNVTYETARSDLLDLAEHGLLEKTMRGRAYVFNVPNDLQERLFKIRRAS